MDLMQRLWLHYSWLGCLNCGPRRWRALKSFTSTVVNQVSLMPSVLPLEGWTSSLQQLPSFNYGCLYAHLSQTQSLLLRISGALQLLHLELVQWSTEEGYLLFPNDYVWMVGFVSTSFATDSHCLFRGLWSHLSRPLETTPQLLLLARSPAMFLVHSVIAKPELVDAVNMLLHCCTTFSTMLNLASHYSRGHRTAME